ncbi:MAG: CorA family divalent cation transporter, partial [Gemmatimonadaceae bacterium]
MIKGAWGTFADSSGAVRQVEEAGDIAALLAAGDGTLWVDVDIREPAAVALLEEVFHFHPLAIEDSLNPQSRVKIEEYANFLILIVRTIAFIPQTADPYDIETVNLTCFLGGNYVVSVHGGQATPIDQIRATLERKPELAASTPSRLMHAIVDEAVNAYFPIL